MTSLSQPFLLCSGALPPICQHRKLQAGILFHEGNRETQRLYCLVLWTRLFGGDWKNLYTKLSHLWWTRPPTGRYKWASPVLRVLLCRCKRGSIFSKLEKHIGVASAYKIRYIAALFSFLRHDGSLLLKTCFCCCFWTWLFRIRSSKVDFKSGQIESFSRCQEL